MRSVHGKNTKPELKVRKVLFNMGYRYRLNRKDLPGKPDIVFPRRRKVIFVHGCFWHGHDCKAGAKQPKTNVEYWSAKISRNRLRDQLNQSRLCDLGWDVLVVWECSLKDDEALRITIRDFLEGASSAQV